MTGLLLPAALSAGTIALWATARLPEYLVALLSMRLELSPEARTEISSGKLPVISRRRDLGPSLSAAGRGA